MKYKSNLYLITLTYLTTVLFSVNSLASPKIKEAKKVDVKCHVELIGGQSSIALYLVKPAKVSRLSKSIENSMVTTPYSAKKQQVYRVFECVLLKEKFNSKLARDLFAKQPR